MYGMEQGGLEEKEVKGKEHKLGNYCCHSWRKREVAAVELEENSMCCWTSESQSIGFESKFKHL